MGPARRASQEARELKQLVVLAKLAHPGRASQEARELKQRAPEEERRHAVAPRKRRVN